MLSAHNIEKLKLNGLYTCKPNVKYRGKLFENNLYHCCNWIFDVFVNNEGNYFMRDTYWSGGGSIYIPLSDDNIDEFELLFERDKVKSIRRDEVYHYDHHYRVAIDSGGWSHPKFFADIDTKKSKKLILGEIDKKISGLENEIRSLRERRKGIEDGTLNLEWY